MPRVDLHAHLFNGYDLPVASFIRRAARPTRLDLVNRWLGKFLRWFARSSPSTEFDCEQIQRAINGTAAFGAPMTVTPEHVLAKVGNLLAQGWRYSRMIREARISRVAMVHHLDAFAQDESDSIDLYVPLCVDMEIGVQEASQSTPLEQFDLMVLLSEASLRGVLKIKGIVLPVIGFDPRRRDDDTRNSLREVRRRVEAGKAVGVKLYPPMGFYPTGNTGPQGQEIDDRLDELYRMCVDLDVPIIAHCSPANSVAKEDGEPDFAHPDGWRQVLIDHPRLRLNLAHVGGLDKGWVKQAVAVVADHYRGQGFVTADISNHDLSGRREIKRFLELLEQSADIAAAVASVEPSQVLSRVAFGSDYWFLHMHARPARFLERYHKIIKNRFGEGSERVDSVFGGAALKLLGFSIEGNKNRARLMSRVERLRTKANFEPPAAYWSVITPRPDATTPIG